MLPEGHPSRVMLFPGIPLNFWIFLNLWYIFNIYFVKNNEEKKLNELNKTKRKTEKVSMPSPHRAGQSQPSDYANQRL